MLLIFQVMDFFDSVDTPEPKDDLETLMKDLGGPTQLETPPKEATVTLPKNDNMYDALDDLDALMASLAPTPSQKPSWMKEQDQPLVKGAPPPPPSFGLQAKSKIGKSNALLDEIRGHRLVSPLIEPSFYEAPVVVSDSPPSVPRPYSKFPDEEQLEKVRFCDYFCRFPYSYHMLSWRNR